VINRNENLTPSLPADNSSYTGTSPELGFMSESLIQIVWRSRWICLSAVLVTLLIAFIYVTNATPVYTSTSRIYVEQNGPQIMSKTEEGVMTQSKNYLYTQAELLKSTPILASALDTNDLKQMKTFNGRANRAAYMKKMLDSAVGKKDDIISLSFNSPYPVEAAQIVNTVVDSYITYHATRKKTTSIEVLKILQNEKDKRDKELSVKLQAMLDFKTENLALTLEGRQGNVVLEKLARLSTLLTEAQLATIQNKSAYDMAQEMVNDPNKVEQFIEAQRAKEISYVYRSRQEEVRSKLSDLQIQLANCLQQVKSNHPLVTSLQSEIEFYKAQLAQSDTEFAQDQLVAAEQQYIAAKRSEEEISKSYEDQRQEVLALNQQQAQYALLQSDWEQTNKLCDILDTRIKELNITEDVGALNISILEVARPASSPSEPQKARVMAIALVMGLMLGGGIALLRGWMDQRLHSAEEISAVLGIPVLGIVPSMSKKQSVSDKGQQVHKSSQSSVAEAYRTIRTAIFFGAPNGRTKTILVTSPAPGDGKTTLVSNLGIAMAQAGQKTLIVDADFRKPMQHKIFQLNHADMGTLEFRSWTADSYWTRSKLL
jgi:polysaccharide biosynthesis transport protein